MCFLTTWFEFWHEHQLSWVHVMAEGVSHCVQSQASPCGICGEQSGSASDLVTKYNNLDFTCHYHSTYDKYIFLYLSLTSYNISN